MADSTLSATIIYNITGKKLDNTAFTTAVTQTFLKSKERSPIAVAIQGTSWSDATANSHFTTNYGGIKVVGDRATIYDNATAFAATKEWNGSAWVAATAVVDGNLLVTGSVTASRINSNGLSIKDNSGNIILAAGTPLDFANVGGTTKPANNANNTSIDASGQIQGVSSGSGTAVANSAITLSSTGALQGAGGGQITTLTATDTRNTNELPSWYPVGQTVEFKSRSAIGVVGVSLYGVLTTYKAWGDASGGAVVQTFASQEALWKRLSVAGNYGQWTTWNPIIDQRLGTLNIDRFMEDGAINSVKLGTNIQSDNYIAGQTGWKISRATGNAEFQNVITRGTVYADAGFFKGNITGATGDFKGTISASAINLNEAGGSTTSYYFGQGGALTIPAGIGSMRATIVGGGGGGAPNTGNFNGAGGGGGGGTTQISVAVTPGASYTVSVGGGGAPGSSGGSSYVYVNGVYYYGYSGTQGSGLSGGSGGTGATTSGSPGANGAARQTVTDAYGNTAETSPAVFGAGGNSGSNWGFGGSAGINGTGSNGSGYGGGGAGGASGSAGYVIVELISAGTQINTLKSQDGRSITTNNLFNGAAKAWINFNGDTGGTRDSFNISGISNVSTGVWTINFSNPMVNASYVVVGTAAGRGSHSTRAVSIAYDVAPTTSSVRIHTGMTGGAGSVGMYENSVYTCIAIFS